MKLVTMIFSAALMFGCGTSTMKTEKETKRQNQGVKIEEGYVTIDHSKEIDAEIKSLEAKLASTELSNEDRMQYEVELAELKKSDKTFSYRPGLDLVALNDVVNKCINSGGRVSEHKDFSKSGFIKCKPIKFKWMFDYKFQNNGVRRDFESAKRHCEGQQENWVKATVEAEIRSFIPGFVLCKPKNFTWKYNYLKWQGTQSADEIYGPTL